MLKISVVCQVYLSVRNGTWCVPRAWDSGLPLDLAVLTRFNNYVFRLLPKRAFSSCMQKAANARFDHALYGLQPNHDFTFSSVVINDDLPSRILSGRVQLRPGIARLTSSGVQFTDGTYVDDIAAVICATGTQPYVTILVRIVRRRYCYHISAPPFLSLSVCLSVCLTHWW